MTDVYNGPNRRINMVGRREVDLVCKEVCKPIVVEFDKRNEKLKIDLDKRDEVFHERLDNLNKCMQDKIPSRLFWKLVGGAAVIIFIGIGGALWEMKSSVADLSTCIKVMNVTVMDTSQLVKDHLLSTEEKFDRYEDRLDAIEKGETYYRYHEKTERQKKEVVK